MGRSAWLYPRTGIEGSDAARADAPNARLGRSDYHGTILRSPFFFLLEDSFFGSALPLAFASSPFALSWASVWLPPVLAGSFGGSAAVAVPSGGLAAGELAEAPGFAGSVCAALAGGASFGAFESVAGVPSAAEDVLSAELTAGALAALAPFPAATVATIEFPVPPSRCWPPPPRTSPLDSSSGLMFGVPYRDAAWISALGPGWKSSIGLPISDVRCRGAFCSALIHATAFGSAGGIGCFNSFSRLFASGTNSDSG